MKYSLSFLLCTLLWVQLHAISTPPLTLKGKVTDVATGNTIPGAVISVPDLKAFAVSAADGSYSIPGLPARTMLVQVSFIGYKSDVRLVSLSDSLGHNVALRESVKEINEVVVTGTSNAQATGRSTIPVRIVREDQLLENSGSNLIDALSSQPGISQISTGAGISKPVIRGLGYNRVVVVNDGIRQEGQQWGDEHGTEIDEYSVKKVEILKGPATLTYGSDAVAGVLHFLSSAPPPSGTLNGSILMNYQTNNGLIGYSAAMDGNEKGFVWNLRYSGKHAHAYQNKRDGYVYNSGFSDRGISAMAGLNKSWGYTHLQASYYELLPGLVEGERDSASGKFIRPLIAGDSVSGEEIVPDSDLRSYSVAVPYQEIRHLKAVLSSSILAKRGALKIIMGFQQNSRKEHGEFADPDATGLHFLLNTINYDVRYIFQKFAGVELSAGISGMSQESENLGTEYLVPAYSLLDAGGFVMADRTFGKVHVAAGLRYDQRWQNASRLILDPEGSEVQLEDSTTFTRFGGFNKTFSGISGSLGMSWEISELLIAKLNAARGYRAPNIAELGSNGEHEGSQRYEYGNLNLKAEQSLQLDIALGLNTEHLSLEADLFHNSIENYIYNRKLSGTSGDSISDGLQSFRFESGSAQLYGAELLADLHPHPLDWLHIGASFAFVNSSLLNGSDSTKHLPMTPPGRARGELRIDAGNKGWFSRIWFRLSAEHYLAQERIFSAYNTETVTPAYTLIGAGAGTSIFIKGKKRCDVIINVNNLLDESYQDHLSRLKYAPMNNATGLNGVSGMGRNISFKLLIPLGTSAS